MPTKKVEVWDIWVRIGHWAMVIAVIMQFITGGDLSWQQAHATVGLLILGWVVFRILWGFWGAGSARFRAFIPTTINALQISLAALRGDHQSVLPRTQHWVALVRSSYSCCLA